MPERWWLGSSLAGMAVSAGLLALALHDEGVRRQAGINGAVRARTEAAVVREGLLSLHFALCLVAAARPSRRTRCLALVAANLALAGSALHRLWSRHAAGARTWRVVGGGTR